MSRVIAAWAPSALLVKNLIARCAVCQNNIRQGVGDSGRERKAVRIFPSLFKCLCKQTKSAEVGRVFKNPLMISYGSE